MGVLGELAASQLYQKHNFLSQFAIKQKYSTACSNVHYKPGGWGTL